MAIDLAGHDLVESPVRVQLPDTSELNGVLKGDLQSLDGAGDRYCYFVRTNELQVLPTWIANFAEVCHQIRDTKLYVIVLRSNPSFERSCKAAGAGLLLLTEENEFQHVLDFDSTLPDALDEAFVGEIRRLRSKLVSKLELELGNLQTRFERISELTAGMRDELVSAYSEGVENQHRLWTEWGNELNVELDRLLAERDKERLAELEVAIDAGPLLDDSV